MKTQLNYGQIQHRIEGGFSVTGALSKYRELVCAATTRIGGISGMASARQLDGSQGAVNRRRMAAIEAANFYRAELDKHFASFADMPMTEIEADNATSETSLADASLGTLSGVLVVQRSLPLFKYQFPVLGALYSDFSAEPGLYNVAEVSRVIVVPAVEEFDPTADSAGRPKGWQTVNAAQTVDAPIKLDSYIGVPIVFGNTMLAGTFRRLFDEQGPASMYAIAKRFVSKVTALLTADKFNAYAAVTPADTDGIVKIPTAYPTFQISLKQFSMDALQDVGIAFDDNEVPPTDRGILLNTAFYNQLKRDPRLNLFWAAARDEAIITEGKLPARIEGFIPYKAPWLPNTGGLVGFPFHKAGILLKQRLPTDWTTVLNVMIPGSVTTVTDPDTGLSCLLVQYVSLQGGYSEWRVETMIGAGPGDKRGGLCMTSP